MLRKSSSKCHKKSRTVEERTIAVIIPESVHERNLHIFSLPLIFVFNILRSVLYLLYVVFRYICRSTSKIFIFSTFRRSCNPDDELSEAVVEPNESCYEYTNEMSCHRAKHLNTPGSVDPLLAKQKDHHRKAFEFISKALKIDEENEGK